MWLWTCTHPKNAKPIQKFRRPRSGIHFLTSMAVRRTQQRTYLSLQRRAHKYGATPVYDLGSICSIITYSLDAKKFLPIPWFSLDASSHRPSGA